jgi:hypothetical protein
LSFTNNQAERDLRPIKTNRSGEPPKSIRLFYNNRWEKSLCSNSGIYIHRSKTRTQSFLATSISLSKSIRLEDLLNFYKNSLNLADEAIVIFKKKVQLSIYG